MHISFFHYLVSKSRQAPAYRWGETARGEESASWTAVKNRHRSGRRHYKMQEDNSYISIHAVALSGLQVSTDTYSVIKHVKFILRSREKKKKLNPWIETAQGLGLEFPAGLYFTRENSSILMSQTSIHCLLLISFQGRVGHWSQFQLCMGKGGVHLPMCGPWYKHTVCKNIQLWLTLECSL